MTISRFFPVSVRQTGGDAGSATTQCSFRYEVRDDWTGVVLTDASPMKPRPQVGMMQAGRGRFGCAFIDRNGDTVLYDAGETMECAICP